MEAASCCCHPRPKKPLANSWADATSALRRLRRRHFPRALAFAPAASPSAAAAPPSFLSCLCFQRNCSSRVRPMAVETQASLNRLLEAKAQRWAERLLRSHVGHGGSHSLVRGPGHPPVAIQRRLLDGMEAAIRIVRSWADLTRPGSNSLFSCAIVNTK